MEGWGKGFKVLVVEDEYFLAEDLSSALNQAGLEVAGPVPTTADAMTLLEGDPAIDAALLDINLRGKVVYDLATELRGRGIPFIFATGYDVVAIPEVFRDAPRVEKPFAAQQILTALKALSGASGAGT
ncbi:MAG: response regulator [Devosia sp.]